MLKRIITGIVAIAIFVPICIASHYDNWNIIFPIAVSLLSAVGVFEMSKCLGYHKNIFLTLPFYLTALILPLLKWYTNFPNGIIIVIASIIIFAILIYVLSYTMIVNGKTKKELKICDALTLFALNFYVIGCFTSIYMVRTSINGRYMYILVFLGAWLCDTFAYFVGVLFGKHKLIPKISPKKTIEGAIGGIVFTVVGFALYALILNNTLSANLSYVKLCILGLVLSVISQIGDLVASLIKRQYDIKDYGAIFPGHGGVLDRFDSVMLVSPVLFILNILIG